MDKEELRKQKAREAAKRFREKNKEKILSYLKEMGYQRQVGDIINIYLEDIHFLPKKDEL